MQLDPQSSIADTLKQAQAQKLSVEVFLRGGQSFRGPVLGVGEQTAVIGPLQGKDFFDAQVRLDDISAVSVQTRNNR